MATSDRGPIHLMGWTTRDTTTVAGGRPPFILVAKPIRFHGVHVAVYGRTPLLMQHEAVPPLYQPYDFGLIDVENWPPMLKHAESRRAV